MRILDQFFISADPMAPLLVGSYNSGLVILSLLVAIFSSGMALHTAHIARMADLRLHRQIAICTGAIAPGRWHLDHALYRHAGLRALYQRAL